MQNDFWYVGGDTNTAFVFIHGIFSNSRECWLREATPTSGSVYWPDLIRTDPRLGYPAIYMAGYHTRFDAGDYSLTDCATEVLRSLEREEIGSSGCVMDKPRIVFIGHSTGGIVARYLIERNREKFENKAVGLALLASPSRGSAWANLLGDLARFLNQRLGQQLARSNDLLEDLHGRFKDLVSKRDEQLPGLFGMEACETKMVYRHLLGRFSLFTPNAVRVVDADSAGQYFGQVRKLPDTDHFTTVKPDSTDHPGHEFLVDFIDEFDKFTAKSTRLPDAARRPTVRPANSFKPEVTFPPDSPPAVAETRKYLVMGAAALGLIAMGLSSSQETKASVQPSPSATPDTPAASPPPGGEELPADWRLALEKPVEEFAVYLASLGLPRTHVPRVWKSSTVPPTDGTKPGPDGQSVFIAPELVSDAEYRRSRSVLLRSHAFRVFDLSRPVAFAPSYWMSAMGSLEAALADYLGASFANDPVVGQAAFDALRRLNVKGIPPRDLSRRWRVGMFPRTQDPCLDGLPWSAAFWDLRSGPLGRKGTDRLLASGYLAIRPEDTRGTFEESTQLLSKRLIATARSVDGDASASALAAALVAHGLLVP